jgi:peptidylprolyl isomerase
MEAAPAPAPAPASAPGFAVGEPGPLAAPPDVAAPPKDARTSPKGVFYKVLVAGKGGQKPTVEDTIRVHYTGWTTDGKMFDSSMERGEPADFPLKHLIPGWVDAIPEMSVGDKVRFWIPEELAYKGRPGTPQGMLVFDVELIAILPPGN